MCAYIKVFYNIYKIHMQTTTNDKRTASTSTTLKLVLTKLLRHHIAWTCCILDVCVKMCMNRITTESLLLNTRSYIIWARIFHVHAADLWSLSGNEHHTFIRTYVRTLDVCICMYMHVMQPYSRLVFVFSFIESVGSVGYQKFSEYWTGPSSE